MCIRENKTFKITTVDRVYLLQFEQYFKFGKMSDEYYILIKVWISF